MDTVQYINIEQLDDHPDNPRLIWREDVVDGISTQLVEQGRFDPAHALLVRPVNGRYQIVRGHHRKQAAIKAGIKSVPCWVREMDDDEAYMQLALGNVQGELSPLEIGIHALKAVNLEQGGRSKTGGLGQYADSIGKQRQDISSYRNAAEVLKAVNFQNYKDILIVLNKAYHFAAVHRTAKELWPILVEWVVTPKDPDKPESTPSVNQTQEMVKTINKYSVPEDWQFFLPLPEIVKSYLENEKPTPRDVSSLYSQAASIKSLIEGHVENLDSEKFPYSVEAFEDWLKGGIGTYAWNLEELTRYYNQIVETAEKAAKPEPIEAKPGGWYKLGKHRLYCGDTGDPAFWEKLPKVKFAFADPPYNADNALWDSGFEWKHDWLIDRADVVAVTPGISSISEFYKFNTGMPYVWSMACWITNGMTRGAVGFGNWIYIALFSRGRIHQQEQDFFKVSIETSTTKETEHKGRKPYAAMLHLLKLFSQEGSIVIDPFLGSGTTLFAADELNQVCYGGEISPEYCSEIINRWQDKTGMQAEETDG